MKTENYTHIRAIANKDVDTLITKGEAYGRSWCNRGGVGAFMMLARKWDRIENLSREGGYDILKAGVVNKGDLLDDIRDLRAYLLLVESEVATLATAAAPPASQLPDWATYIRSEAAQTSDHAEKELSDRLARAEGIAEFDRVLASFGRDPTGALVSFPVEGCACDPCSRGQVFATFEEDQTREDDPKVVGLFDDQDDGYRHGSPFAAVTAPAPQEVPGVKLFDAIGEHEQDGYRHRSVGH
jgi:hypothetical protein